MSSYSLPALDYAIDALEPHYSAELLELHHQGHHAAYVSTLNQVCDELRAARDEDQHRWLPRLQNELAFNLAGHALHSLFWKSLDPESDSDLPLLIQKRIDDSFGSLDAFKARFETAALSLQGAGWAALTIEPTTGQLLIEQIHDHHNNCTYCTRPLLVIDMWEHAFYLQYRTKKSAWLEAFWQIVNWNNVLDLMKESITDGKAIN